MTCVPALLLVAAACGSPAKRTPARPDRPDQPVANGGPPISLERIERIARACLADHGKPLDWVTVGFARSDAGWRVSVDETKQPGASPPSVDVVVEPGASTCDGRAIDSAPEAGDVSIEEVTAIARRCHAGKIDEDKTELAYHHLATGDLDRGRYEVVFVEPGVIHPGPHYLVDAGAGTCKRIEDTF